VFIYHFNRLINSRFVWGFFAIIISVAFVSVGSCARSSRGGIVAGKLNGKKISAETFSQAEDAIRGIGRGRNRETPVREVDRKAWEQIAALQVARKNGLAIGVEEVRNEIRGQRGFQDANGFNFNYYLLALREHDTTEAQYETLVRNQLLMMKVGSLIDTASWISPMELDDELDAMTDTFTVQTATISNRFAGVEMRLSDDAYKTFYEENKPQFGLPDRMSVRYISIPVSNYLARVTVSDDEILDYYDSHPDKFKTSDTNSVTGVKPLDEVKDEIVAELQVEEAREGARKDLMFTIFDRSATTPIDSRLEALATREQVEVKTTPLFSQSEPLAWTSDAQAFANAAFELEPESIDTRFAIVDGDAEILVIEYHQKSDAHVPPFEDVEEDVKRRTQDKARVDAFDDYVKEIRGEIAEQIESGKAFEDAAKEKSLNVSTSLTYTVSGMQMKPFENSFSIAYGAMGLAKGGLSEAVPSSATQSLLIYVQDREQGDALSADMMRPQIRAGMVRRRTGTLISDWLKWNLDQQRFEPSRTVSSGDDEETQPSEDDGGRDSE